MRIFVVVNRLTELGPRQTTTMLIASLLERGCDVEVADVHGISMEGDESGNRFALAAAKPEVPNVGGRLDVEAIANWAVADPVRRHIPIAEGDLVWIRTNPGRDAEHADLHRSWLHGCRLCQERGVRVVNEPGNLDWLASKSSLLLLDPKYRPAMLVTREAEQVASFVDRSGVACVVKPLFGSRGADVIRVMPRDSIAKAVMDRYVGRSVVVQHFVHAPQPGDKRVLVLDGELLTVDGWPAGIERRPAAGEFRANLHAGAQAQPLNLNAAERAAVNHAAALLKQHGIWLAGVDLMGDQIIEFNVFSTGGLFDAQRFRGVDFAGAIVDQLLTGA